MELEGEKMWILLILPGLICAKLLGRYLGHWVTEQLFAGVLAQADQDLRRRQQRVRYLEQLLSDRSNGGVIIEYSYCRLDQASQLPHHGPDSHWRRSLSSLEID